ncbi:MAG: VUT family protein [Spartobacteria bacterium]|nr:VUT family protein [Spartobacteria bacterium]
MNEWLWVLMMALNFGTILCFYRLFGKAGLFAWVPLAVIVANIQVLKTVKLFGLEATLGNIVYATSFLVTDILSENYGRKDAARAVLLGFLSLLVMTVMMNLALRFVPASSDFAQPALATIFSIMPRIALASVAAFLVAQFHDVWAYHLWRKHFPATRHIWIRNNASTVVSQLLDTMIFTGVAFWGVFERGVLIQIFITTALLKIIVAGCDTPFVYIARWMHDTGRVGSSLLEKTGQIME